LGTAAGFPPKLPEGNFSPPEMKMTTHPILSLLDSVRSRGTGKWSAKCPAHPDRSPSLSIAEGQKGLLLKCWAGCTIQEITSALGLRVSDLFHGNQLPLGSRPRPFIPGDDRRRRAFHLEVQGVGLQDRGLAVLRSATGMDCRDWLDADLEQAMEALGRAHDDLVYADILFKVADDLRVKDYEERR
jgi:hypothetical protein